MNLGEMGSYKVLVLNRSLNRPRIYFLAFCIFAMAMSKTCSSQLGGPKKKKYTWNIPRPSTAHRVQAAHSQSKSKDPPQLISFPPSALAAIVDYYLDILFHLTLQNDKYLTFIFYLLARILLQRKTFPNQLFGYHGVYHFT